MDKLLGYSEENGIVTIRMTMEDYENLLLKLGIVAGHEHRSRDLLSFRHSIALANRLNAGNKRWTPYEIPGEQTA